MKTIEKRGLQSMADEAGIDLWKLPFEDARPQRKEWLAANPQVRALSRPGPLSCAPGPAQRGSSKGQSSGAWPKGAGWGALLPAA